MAGAAVPWRADVSRLVRESRVTLGSWKAERGVDLLGQHLGVAPLGKMAVQG
jgi:hypothetical protein